MSALGQKQTSEVHQAMSALPRKRTCAEHQCMSALGQKRTHAAQQYHSLFDHLVGLRKKAWGDGYAEGLGCPEVDHQLELGRCLHGEVGGFFAFKDAIDIASRLPELLDGISAIRHQPAAGGKEAVVI